MFGVVFVKRFFSKHILKSKQKKCKDTAAVKVSLQDDYGETSGWG